MARKKQHYKEGDWFAVPLEEGGYALGLIARMKGTAIFGYFFGKWFADVPSLKDTHELRPSEAIARLIFGDLALKNREWIVLGPLPDWDRTKWPMPDFKHNDTFSGNWYIRKYDENFPNRAFHTEQRVSAVEVANLPDDGTFGAAAIVIRISRLLQRE